MAARSIVPIRKAYERDLLPLGADEHAREKIAIAFYGGVISTLTLLTEALDRGGTKAFWRQIEIINAEFEREAAGGARDKRPRRKRGNGHGTA